MRSSVPKRLSKEVLLVDLLHNLDRLPEDQAAILPRALAKAREMDRGRLARAVREFGSARAERLLAPVFEPTSGHTAHAAALEHFLIFLNRKGIPDAGGI
jgi:hypothetical protein